MPFLLPVPLPVTLVLPLADAFLGAAVNFLLPVPLPVPQAPEISTNAGGVHPIDTDASH